MAEERQAQLTCNRLNPLNLASSLLLAKNAMHLPSSMLLLAAHQRYIPSFLASVDRLLAATRLHCSPPHILLCFPNPTAGIYPLLSHETCMCAHHV